MAFEKVLLQIPFSSFTRMLNTCIPKLGILVLSSKKYSTAWSMTPSKEDIGVALPCPGSVSQKNSAPSIPILRNCACENKAEKSKKSINR